ncbi:hypothetical protein [Paenibacillus cymbidii]|uniref:hypothetical protein n=1 Tax=Paenibacillus cymbidii TaxID=1639034 RepID=UPI001081CC5D|nr:hypothetical protein [Paenibacillus cymbidii]
MAEQKSFWAAWKKRLANRESTGDKAGDGAPLPDPKTLAADEVVRNKAFLALEEQLQIIHKARKHLEEYVFPTDPGLVSWRLGFAIDNEVFVSVVSQDRRGSEMVRCQLSAFWQDAETGRSTKGYRISMIRFGDDGWRVFQVREMETGQAREIS